LGGLAVTAIAAEVCRYGYIPTEDEVLAGATNPLFDPDAGCDGINADRLWLCQVRGPVDAYISACMYALHIYTGIYTYIYTYT
jgi:hypothetical protein